MRPTRVAALGLLLVVGCRTAPRLSAAQPGPMPEGETYTGTYADVDTYAVERRSDLLSIVEEHGVVRGVLKLSSGPRGVSGELKIEGKATGDLVRFTWHQGIYPGEERFEGRGYFRISRRDSRVLVVGEVGTHEDETGTAFRLEKTSSSRPTFGLHPPCPADLECSPGILRPAQEPVSVRRNE